MRKAAKKYWMKCILQNIQNYSKCPDPQNQGKFDILSHSAYEDMMTNYNVYSAWDPETQQGH